MHYVFRKDVVSKKEPYLRIANNNETKSLFFRKIRAFFVIFAAELCRHPLETVLGIS